MPDSAKLILFLLILTPVLACSNNTLFVAEATCFNCTNQSAAYVCFDWEPSITNGILTSTWYSSAEVLNTTTGAANDYECYNNQNNTLLCTTNYTYFDQNFTFSLRSPSTPGYTFTSCGFGGNCGYTYLRELNCSTCFTNGTPMVVNGTLFNVGGPTDQIIWTMYDNTTEIQYDDSVTYHVLYSNCTTRPQEIEYGNGTSSGTVWDTTRYSGVWHMGEGSGINITNSIQGHANGTLYGSADWGDNDFWVPGQFGFGVNVSNTGAGGTFNHIQFPNDTSTDLAGVPYMIEIWIQRHETGSWGSPAVYSKCDAAGVCGQPNYKLSTAAGAGFFWVWADQFNGANRCLTCSVGQTWSISTSEFDYVVVRRNATYLSLFHNGELKCATACGFWSGSSAQPLMIGRHDQAPNIGVNTTVDEFRIHKNSFESDEWINATYWARNATVNAQQTMGTFTNFTTFQPNVTQSYGFYTIRVMDEETETYFDMSTVTNGTIATVCQDSVGYTNITAANTYYIVTTAPPLWFKLEANITQEVYYRKQVPDCTWPCIEVVDIYLVNLANKVLVQLTLFINDLVGGFTQGKVTFSHPITAGNVQITSDIFDVENKVIVYLIRDQYYTICVENRDRTETRCLGFLVIDTITTKTITINPLYPTTENLYTDIVVGLSQNGTNLVLVYNDTTLTTTNVTWNVFNGTNISQLLYSTSATTDSAQFTYLFGANQTYISNLISETTAYGTNVWNKTTWGGVGANLWDLGFDTETNRTIYDVASVLILMSLAVMWGPTATVVSCFVVAVTGALLQLMGWMTSGNLVIDGVIFGGALLLSFFNIFAEKRDRGG